MTRTSSTPPPSRPAQKGMPFPVPDNDAEKKAKEILKNEMLGKLKATLNDANWESTLRISAYGTAEDKIRNSDRYSRLYVLVSGKYNGRDHTNVLFYDVDKKAFVNEDFGRTAGVMARGRENGDVAAAEKTVGSGTGSKNIFDRGFEALDRLSNKPPGPKTGGIKRVFWQNYTGEK